MFKDIDEIWSIFKDIDDTWPISYQKHYIDKSQFSNLEQKPKERLGTKDISIIAKSTISLELWLFNFFVAFFSG